MRRHEFTDNQVGDLAFNTKFDTLSRGVSDRLRRYGSAIACGRWNATLIEDFRSDADFIRNANELFAYVVTQHTHGRCITPDGLAVENAIINLGESIVVYFRLHFLDAPNGYGIAPAKFSVRTVVAPDNITAATLCCGLSPPDGDFWYPPTNRVPSAILPNDYAWAFSLAREYGSTKIASWIDRQTRRGSEPSPAPEPQTQAF